MRIKPRLPRSKTIRPCVAPDRLEGISLFACKAPNTYLRQRGGAHSRAFLGELLLEGGGSPRGADRPPRLPACLPLAPQGKSAPRREAPSGSRERTATAGAALCSRALVARTEGWRRGRRRGPPPPAPRPEPSAGLPWAGLFGAGGPPPARRESLWAGKAAFKSGARRTASFSGAERGRPGGRAQLPRAEQGRRRRAAGAGGRPPGGARRTGGRREDAGGRLHAGEGGRAGEAQRRLAAAVEEEALRAHPGRAAAHPAQAARAGAGRRRRRAPRRRGGQDQGAALRHHEDGGLRGAEGQVRVLHGGDGRGQGDRLSVPAGAGLERRDHAAAGAVQEPPGHPGRPLHPPEAAAPGPAARAPPAQRLQLRLAQVEFRRHLQARWTLDLLITNLANENSTATWESISSSAGVFPFWVQSISALGKHFNSADYS